MDSYSDAAIFLDTKYWTEHLRDGDTVTERNRHPTASRDAIA